MENDPEFYEYVRKAMSDEHMLFLRRLNTVYSRLCQGSLHQNERHASSLRRPARLLSLLSTLEEFILVSGVYAINISHRCRTSYQRAKDSFCRYPSTVAAFIIVGTLRRIEKEVRKLLEPLHTSFKQRLKVNICMCT